MPLLAELPNSLLADIEKRISDQQRKLQQDEQSGQPVDQRSARELGTLRAEQATLVRTQRDQADQRYQPDWAARTIGNGNSTGLFAEYHY